MGGRKSGLRWLGDERSLEGLETIPKQKRCLVFCGMDDVWKQCGTGSMTPARPASIVRRQ